MKKKRAVVQAGKVSLKGWSLVEFDKMRELLERAAAKAIWFAFKESQVYWSQLYSFDSCEETESIDPLELEIAIPFAQDDREAMTLHIPLSARTRELIDREISDVEPCHSLGMKEDADETIRRITRLRDGLKALTEYIDRKLARVEKMRSAPRETKA